MPKILKMNVIYSYAVGDAVLIDSRIVSSRSDRITVNNGKLYLIKEIVLSDTMGTGVGIIVHDLPGIIDSHLVYPARRKCELNQINEDERD